MYLAQKTLAGGGADLRLSPPLFLRIYSFSLKNTDLYGVAAPPCCVCLGKIEKKGGGVTLCRDTLLRARLRVIVNPVFFSNI